MIKYIYHLADVHFRNVKRHTEYRDVLVRFLSNVDNCPPDENKDNSIIYIAGDIAHTKTDMSPELIREISWFLQECAMRRHTFIIAGNHDCNLSNSDRLDVLTPIVENLNNDSIHYLKYAGVTEYKNIIFSTYSLLSDQSEWVKGLDIDDNDKIKICLFHGAVKDSKTDVGYVIDSDKYSLSMFDGFDYVLLGDIHKRQVLQQRNVANGAVKPFVAYPSSTIQQDHGESVLGHGYMKLNLESGESVAVDLYNEYGYVTFDISDGKLPLWFYTFDADKYPKKIRCRVRYHNTSKVELDVCIAEIKSKFQVVDISIFKSTNEVILGSSNTSLTHSIDNVLDDNVRSRIIRDFVFGMGASDDVCNKVLEIDGNAVSELTESKSSLSNVLWQPVLFEFSNMFSYGADNYITFDKVGGVVGIFAPNAQGKTSLIEALTYCIFGKTSKTHLARNVINNRKDNFKCKLQLLINGKDYYIERVGKQSKNGSVKVDVNFWLNDGGIVINLNGVSVKETNSIIQEHLGLYDDFALTTLSSQTNNTLFADKGQADRKDTLSKFMGLEIFDSLYDVANGKYKEIVSVVKRYQDKVDDIDLQSIELEIRDINDSIASKIRTGKSLRSDADTISNQIEKLKESIIKIEGGDVDVDYLNVQINKHKKSIETHNLLLKGDGGLEQSIDKYNTMLIDLKEQLKLLGNRDEIKRAYDHYNYLLNTVVVDLKRLISANDALLKSNMAELEGLREYKYNSDCDVCVTNNANVIKRINELSKSIENATNENTEHTTKLDAATQEIDLYKESKYNLEEYDTMYQKILKLENKISEVKLEIANKHAIIDKDNATIDKLVKQIKNAEANAEQIEKNKKTQADVSVLSGDLKVKNEKMNVLRDEISALKVTLGRLTERLDNQKSNISELDQLKEQMDVYELYLKAVHRNGIPHQMIHSAIPVLESEINAILSQIVNFGVNIEMDEKNIDINIMYDGDAWSLDMASGMERFVSGLAMRLALTKLCNLPKSNFLIIDEGFGALDGETLASIHKLFGYLKSQFEFVLIVSHIESMKDMVDMQIEIEKSVDGYSNVTC